MKPKVVHQDRTNRQIQQLLLEKRHLWHFEWQKNRSPASKDKLKAATRKLSRVLKQEENLAQHQYIEQLSPTCAKNPVWKARSLSASIETDSPIRSPTGSWARSDYEKGERDCNTPPRSLPTKSCDQFIWASGILKLWHNTHYAPEIPIKRN